MMLLLVRWLEQRRGWWGWGGRVLTFDASSFLGERRLSLGMIQKFRSQFLWIDTDMRGWKSNRRLWRRLFLALGRECFLPLQKSSSLRRSRRRGLEYFCRCRWCVRRPLSLLIFHFLRRSAFEILFIRLELASLHHQPAVHGDCDAVVSNHKNNFNYWKPTRRTSLGNPSLDCNNLIPVR